MKLLDLYAPDALVLRSNLPLLRGAAAVREFFFSAIESGLGEVAVEPIRVEVLGDLAHEVGRYSALVPGTAGKRARSGANICGSSPSRAAEIGSWSRSAGRATLRYRARSRMCPSLRFRQRRRSREEGLRPQVLGLRLKTYHLSSKANPHQAFPTPRATVPVFPFVSSSCRALRRTRGSGRGRQ